MEVPVIHRINDFQIASSSLAGIQSVSAAYNFCKWSAVILALVAAFGSIVNRIKIIIIRLRHQTQSFASSNLLTDLDDYSSSSDGEDDSYSSPSTVLSEYEEEEDEDEHAESSRTFHWWRVDEDFMVRGSGQRLDDHLQSGKMRHRRRCSIGEIFSLSEIANSKSVVKLWDSIGFGLGLDFDDYESSSSDATVVSAEKTASAPAQSSLSPAVVVSAGESASGNLALTIWDTRLRRRTPAVIAEWESNNEGKVVGLGCGGVEKVYVKDNVRYRLTVGDMRKVTSPLGSVTESDLDTWWDKDAVIVSGESDQSFLRRK